MRAEILLSGFGGQGLLRLGKILATAALRENKYTIWFPSYGGEVRGGTAHCFVKISDQQISSPFIEEPDIAVILNQPSLDKFGKKIKRGGLAILNSDLIEREILRKDIKKISLPLNKIALDCGNVKVANIVALGAISFLTPGFLKKETITAVLKEAFANKKEVLDANLRAFRKGEESAAR